MIRDTPAGVEFEVRVTPRANKTQIDVPRGAIRILSGERSRLKRISISGVTAAQIRALVG